MFTFNRETNVYVMWGAVWRWGDRDEVLFIVACAARCTGIYTMEMNLNQSNHSLFNVLSQLEKKYLWTIMRRFKLAFLKNKWPCHYCTYDWWRWMCHFTSEKHDPNQLKIFVLSNYYTLHKLVLCHRHGTHSFYFQNLVWWKKSLLFAQIFAKSIFHTRWVAECFLM